MSLVGPTSWLAWLALISLIAGAAKGLTGFGGALVMAPLFGLLLPPSETGALIVLVHCATSLQGAGHWAGTARWRAVIPLALLAIACTAWAAPLLAQVDGSMLRHLVALAVLLVTALHLKGWRWRHQGGWRPTLVAGLSSGVLTALAGLGGPPAVYYFSGITQGAVLRAHLLAYFAILFSGAALVLLLGRQIRLPQLETAALLIPCFALGVTLGERLGRRLPAHWFDRIVSSLLLGAGLIALVT